MPEWIKGKWYYTEQEYKELIGKFLEDLNSNMWIKDIIKKWEAKKDE